MLPIPPASDYLLIEGFQSSTIVGVYPHERHSPQPIAIDLALGFDFHPSSKSDRLKDTLDYDAAIRVIEHRLKAPAYQLLEALGEAICQDCFERFAISWAAIRLYKPHLFDHVQRVGVVLFRQSDDVDS